MYSNIISWDNLMSAASRAAKGKRSQPNVAAFEHNLAENLLQLQQELVDQTYRPGDYSSFYIHEPKRRLISAAPFRDRVVHHALCLQIEPLFERSFIDDSYANRKGKGTHRALNRVQQLARRYPYVLPLDLRQFFPSIDYAILRQILFKKVKDPQSRWLIEQVLASGIGVLVEQYDVVYFPGDDLFAPIRNRGLPIGNLTSQFWANCYLNPFDHFVKRQLVNPCVNWQDGREPHPTITRPDFFAKDLRQTTRGCKGYARYVDDLLLFADNKQTLWQWKEAIVERLARLRLTVHAGSHPRPVTEGIPYLGFIVYPDRRRLKRRKVVHFRRRFRAKIDAYQAGEITLDELTASVQGWVNHVRFANSMGLRKAVLTRQPLN